MTDDLTKEREKRVPRTIHTNEEALELAYWRFLDGYSGSSYSERDRFKMAVRGAFPFLFNTVRPGR